MAYDRAQVVAEGMALVWHWKYGRALWTRCKMRKVHTCRATKRTIAKGDWAWRPTGNMTYRMERISDKGILALSSRTAHELSEIRRIGDAR